MLFISRKSEIKEGEMNYYFW